jgi:hypothetical protein
MWSESADVEILDLVMNQAAGQAVYKHFNIDHRDVFLEIEKVPERHAL